MSWFYLLDEQTTIPDWNSILLKYLIYLAIIVIGIVALILLKKFNRLPKHAEVQHRLNEVLSSLKEYAETASQETTTYGSFTSMGKLHYALEKLSYTTSMLSQKERDSDMSTVSDLLERASDLLSPYKLSKFIAEKDDETIATALEQVQKAADLLDRIIIRDQALKQKRK